MYRANKKMKFTNTFNEAIFRQSVNKALQRVKTILDTTRHPRLAGEGDDNEHTYDDKYALAEFLINTGIAAKMNALERLGLDAEKLKQISQWVHQDKQSVTLRFQAVDSCDFLKENIVELSSPGPAREIETTTTAGSFLGMGTSSKTETVKTKVVTKVKEFHWKVGLEYRVFVYKGSDPNGATLELQSRKASTVLITSGGQQVAPRGVPTSPNHKPKSPLAEKTVHPPIDLNLTWFFQKISPKDFECQFSIDRDSAKAIKTCKTPRRNADMDAAFEFDQSLSDWTNRTHGFFLNRVERQIMDKHQPADPRQPEPTPLVGNIATIIGLQKEPTFNGKQVRVVEFFQDQQRYRVDPVDTKAGLPSTLLIKPQNLKSDSPSVPQNGPSLTQISDSNIFGPVVPLMENGSILSMGDVAEFLNEQNRSLDEAIDNLSRLYPPRQLMKLLSVAEATIVQVCHHLRTLASQCSQGVDYIENMLKTQLVQAIGKEVNSKDFDKYIHFHHQKFFGYEYTPKPFCHAIRRPAHYPDGILSIEATDDKREPIETWVRHVPGGDQNPPMYMPINAATAVELRGDRFLHGWMLHEFQATPRPSFELGARARQFSSFILIIGVMLGGNKFGPKHAIILQNKDEVVIPLLANPLPSAKEFKDAIVSLSPEQKSFAKAYRAMQLESSVFGVCVIQLKPQLEKLLGLPDGALTKEIQLTQDLMSLFVEYQIPSDLLSFDGDENASLSDKVAAVKGYVKGVMDVIEGEKKKQLKEEAMKADMRGEKAYALSNDDKAEVEYFPQAATFSGPSAPFSGSPAPFSGSPAPFSGSPAPFSGSPALDSRSSGARASQIGFRAMAPLRAPGAMVASMSVDLMEDFRGAAPSEAAVPERHVAARRSYKEYEAAARSPPPSKKASITPRQELVQPPAEKLALAGRGDTVGDDFTTIPRILDTKLEKYDTDGALRSTIIKASQNWMRNRQENLLTPALSARLNARDIDGEQKKAFDLLDALSRSGTLPIVCSELHVVIAVSHCFENDVMGTIIQDNINPIAKVEKSALMLASAVFAKSAVDLISSGEDVERLTGSFPELMSTTSEAVEVYQDSDS